VLRKTSALGRISEQNSWRSWPAASCKRTVYGLNGLRPLRGRVEIWRGSLRAPFLFWSATARSSKGVEKEWRHRFTYRGLGSITPNGLEHQSCASLQMSWRLSNSAHPSCMSLSRAVRCRKRAERRAKRGDREGALISLLGWPRGMPVRIRPSTEHQSNLVQPLDEKFLGRQSA